jgi:DNA-directed RNA polymerase specialized sigma24 family protein
MAECHARHGRRGLRLPPSGISFDACAVAAHARPNTWYGCPMASSGDGLPDLSDAEWSALYEKTLIYARRLTDDRAHARDLVQEAFSRLFTTRTWDENRGVPLSHFLARIVRSVASHERSSKRAEIDHAAAAEWDLTGGGVSPSAEEVHRVHADIVRRRETSATALAELTQRLAGWPLELTLISAMLDGIMKPEALAVHAKRDVNDVYKAIRRIKRYAQSLDEGARPSEELS